MTRRWLTLVAAGMIVPAVACSPREVERPSADRPRPVSSTVASTSRDGLTRTIADGRARVAQKPEDVSAAITLADALLRQTRVTNNAGLSVEAADVLQAALRVDPGRYEARRMLASVFLSLHRFRDALREAARCQATRRDDAFVEGVIGDAHLELGDYDEAFAAFDRMNRAKPTAASYARASYARELQGDLPAAVRFMQMALEATPPQDTEALAWHHAQLGHLHLDEGRLTDARREYSHAEFIFPGHPFASDGLARVAAASGDRAGALAIVERRIADNPMPADFALAGDLSSALGRPNDAERHYRLAEAAWRSDVPEPSRLARFLAERGRRLDEAVRLAESAFAERRDIYSADALAWALFKAGDLNRAEPTMAQALRTGTRDRVILYHAAEIARAVGQTDRARRLVRAATDGSPRFDLIAAPAAARLSSALGIARTASR